MSNIRDANPIERLRAIEHDFEGLLQENASHAAAIARIQSGLVAVTAERDNFRSRLSDAESHELSLAKQCQALSDKLAAYESQLTALRRPVGQSEAIEGIRKIRPDLSRWAPVVDGKPVTDTLFDALDQAQRELSAVRAAANKQGDGDLAELERLRAEIARLSSPQLEAKVERLEQFAPPDYWATLHDRLASVISWKQRCTNAEKRIERLEGALRKVKRRIDQDCTVMGIEPHSWHSICLHYSEVVQIFEALAAADGQHKQYGCPVCKQNGCRCRE